MKLFNDEQLLDESFRAAVIQEINGPENTKRKEEAFKRYQIYKDKTLPYVLQKLNEEDSDKKACDEVKNRAANVSFVREFIEKKGMVYKDGVSRLAFSSDKNAQQQVDMLTELLNINSKMKKGNKYTELFKNALVTVLPYESQLEDNKYRLMVNILQSYLYDAIEDHINPEMARAYIFSYYNPGGSKQYKMPFQAGNRESPTLGGCMPGFGDGRDQVIADSPSDKGSNNKEYVWWSNKYHFTTDSKGQIILGRQEDDLSNPIGRMPMYNISMDQDGQFWAQGGDDIIDAGVLINLLLTDLFYIAKYQGMGIGYAFGKGVPKNLKVGPASFISMDVGIDDPVPQVGFATSNPPIDSHLSMIKDYLSYVLLTNKLQPDMADAKISQSGIHEMIKQSSNIDDIEDQKEVYRDAEPVIYDIIKRWFNLYFERDLLDSDFLEIGKLPDDLKVKVKFKDSQPFMTEMEKLQVIEKRLELGLDDMADAMKKDNPELSDDEAKEKVRKMLETKLMESRKKLMKLRENFNGEQSDVQAEPEAGSESRNFEKADT